MADLREMTIGITFEDHASKAIDVVNKEIDAIGLGFANLSSDLSGTEKGIKNFGKSGTGSIEKVDDAMTGLRDEFSAANFDINDFGKTTVQAMDRADDSVDNLTDSLDDVKRGLNDMSNSKIDDVTGSAEKADVALDNAADEADNLGNELADAGRRGEQAASGLGSAFMKVAGILGAVFAVDKIKDFGIGIVEEAGEVEAATAQFETTFGEMQGAANESIEGMAADFGMLPTRLNATFTKTTSMFKGFGMSTENAMEAAGKSVELAADAAAFYDVSLDNADAALTSFLKGNTNAAESIGVFATAAGIASYASEELGLDWKKLDEGSKQLVRMRYVETMQEAAGATGQAARESEGYENVLGNMKQAWTDLRAGLGIAIFDTAIDGMQTMTDYIVNFDIEPVVEGLSNAVEVGVGFATAIRDNWGPIKETVIGVSTAVGSFALIMGGLTVIGTINKLMEAYRLGTMAATLTQMGLNGAMLASPITWVVAGIASLIAIGVLLYRNWDTIKVKAGELWSAIQVNWEQLKHNTAQTWLNVKESISTAMINATVSVANFFSPLLSFIASAKSAWDGFKGAVANFKMPSFGMPKFLGGGGMIQVDGSNAAGLGRVPFDGYVSELHKDESVLTAQQSNALRSAGMLKGDGVGPTLDLNPMQQFSKKPRRVAAESETQSSITNESVLNNDHSRQDETNIDQSKVSTYTENNNTFHFHISGQNAEDIGRKVRDEIEALFGRMNAVTE